MKLKFKPLSFYLDHVNFVNINRFDVDMGSICFPRDYCENIVNATRINDDEIEMYDSNIYDAGDLLQYCDIIEDDKSIECGDYTMHFNGTKCHIACQVFDIPEMKKICNFLLDCLGYDAIEE